MRKQELEKKVMELETELAVTKVKANTIAALTDVTRLQAAIIDHLYMVLCNVDGGMVDDHTLAQMQRAAEITDYYT